MRAATSLHHANQPRHRSVRPRHSAATPSRFGYAAHVGRVGALAVALGIGAAVASAPGMAWADDGTDNAKPAQNTPGTPDAGTTNSTPAAHPDLGAVIRHTLDRTADTVRKVVTGVVHSSGGALTSTVHTGTPPSTGTTPTLIPRQQTLTGHQTTTTTNAPTANTPAAQPFTPAASGVVTHTLHAVDDATAALHTSAQQITGALTTPHTTQNQGTTPPFTAAAVTTAAVTPQVATATQPNPVVRVVSGLLAAIGIAPDATNSPVPPLSPSTLLGALALIRRELEHTFANQAPNLPATTSLTVNQNSSKSITMPATDADGDTLTYSVPAKGQPGGPQHGAATVTGNTITYTPDQNYAPAPGTADDTFTVTASDANSGFHIHALGQSHTDTEQVTVDVNAAPVAKNDAGSVTAGGTTIINVLANDTDADNGLAVNSVAITQQPASGTATANSDGTITYTSTGTTATSDSFTYTVKDQSGATSNPATATVTVTAVNAAPVGTATASAPDDNGNVTITLKTGGGDGDPVTVTAPDPTTGSLTLVSTSAPDAGGVVTRTYRYTPDGQAQLDSYNNGAGAGATPETETLSFQVKDAAHASTPTEVPVTVTVSPALAAFTNQLPIDAPGYVGTISTTVNPKNDHVYATVLRNTAFDEEGNPTQQTVSVVDVSDNNRIVGDAYNVPPNFSGDNVTLFDVYTDTVVDKDGNVYVTEPNFNGQPIGTVVRINADGTANSVIPVEGAPGDLAVSPDGSTVYVRVLNPNDGGEGVTGTVVNLAHPDAPIGEPVVDAVGAAIYTDMAVDSQGRVYTTNYTRVPVLDADGNETGNTYTTDVVRYNTDGTLTTTTVDGVVTDIAASPDGHLYIELADLSDSGVSKYSLVDLTTGDEVDLTNTDPQANQTQFITDVEFGHDIAVSPDGKRIVVSNGDGVTVIDTASHTIIATAPSDSGTVIKPTYSADGQHVYLQNPSSGDVSVVSFADQPTTNIDV